ncbi:hypothetical protein O181_055612 [Austropuccinia psidii MF-1]|uniref:Uncharacterized protein n=1 Tax=Austropuccinia psidii MF-1 TaxID=1389203 RepID=A0A9Q3EE13_9BASI|nr:hypothetical protein [Austropuccinia psidii MF-1]
MLEKGWNPRLPAATLRKDLIEIHPTAYRFKIILDKLKHHAKQSQKKLKYSLLGPFVIVALHGANAVQVEWSAYKELFPLRNPNPLTVPQVEQSEEKKIKKIIKERRIRVKNLTDYLFRYRNPVHEDEWLAESEIPDSD